MRCPGIVREPALPAGGCRLSARPTPVVPFVTSNRRGSPTGCMTDAPAMTGTGRGRRFRMTDECVCSALTPSLPRVPRRHCFVGGEREVSASAVALQYSGIQPLPRVEHHWRHTDGLNHSPNAPDPADRTVISLPMLSETLSPAFRRPPGAARGGPRAARAVPPARRRARGAGPRRKAQAGGEEEQKGTGSSPTVAGARLAEDTSSLVLSPYSRGTSAANRFWLELHPGLVPPPARRSDRRRGTGGLRP